MEQKALQGLENNSDNVIESFINSLLEANRYMSRETAAKIVHQSLEIGDEANNKDFGSE